MKKNPAENEKIKLITDKYNAVMHKNDTDLDKLIAQQKHHKTKSDQYSQEQTIIFKENEDRLRELTKHFQELKVGETTEYQKFIDAYINLIYVAIKNILVFKKIGSDDIKYLMEKESIKEKIESAKNAVRTKGELYVNSLSNPVKLNPDIITALERIYLIRDKYVEIINKSNEAVHKLVTSQKYNRITEEEYNNTKISIFKEMKDNLQNLSKSLQKLKTGKIKEYDELVDAYLVNIEVDIEYAIIYKQFTDEDLDYWLEKKQIAERRNQAIDNTVNLINIYMQSQGISNEDTDYFEKSR